MLFNIFLAENFKSFECLLVFPFILKILCLNMDSAKYMVREICFYHVYNFLSCSKLSSETHRTELQFPAHVGSAQWENYNFIFRLDNLRNLQ